MKKWLSRKLWVTVLTALLTPVLQRIGLSDEVIMAVVAAVAAYLLGQSYVDGQEAKAKS